MRLKVLLLSTIISIFAFFGMNAFAKYFTGFWYEIEISNRPELIEAEVNKELAEKELKELKLTRARIFELKEVGINSRAAISVQNDKELFSLNADDQVPIASITKLMTALVVFENYDLNLLVPISQEAVNQEGESRYGNIWVGEELSVENLLYAMLIESSNDIAYALTEPVGYDAFIELMNFKAKSIGMENTFFVNPTGLEPDDPEGIKNYSTARDLVKLAKYILENQPEIFEITKNDSYRILKPNGRLHHFIAKSTNKLLAEVPEIIGGKTGYSPAAGGCLLTILKDNRGNRYINIVLGARDRFAETRKIITAIQ